MSRLPEVTNKLRQTVVAWHLWNQREPLLVAVSGGVDSMVLADLLRKLPPGIRPELTVAHYNHNLRGRESERDARFVKKICRAWKLPCLVGKAPRWRSKENLQERARELRYRFFAKQAKRLGIRILVTAHHADDQAETFLIRWIQGAGLKGLAGIPIVGEVEGIKVVRPLLEITKREILGYARSFKIPYREDGSNLKTDYLRNRVRKMLRSLEKLNPSLARTTARNAQFLRADEEFLDRSLNGLGESRVSLADYRRLPEALRYRLLRRLYQRRKERGALGADHILSLDRLLHSPTPRQSLDLPGGLRFEKDYLRFRIFKSSRKPPASPSNEYSFPH